MYNNNKQIVVRVAPSPTGNLHIGTARTALFNFLIAKKFNGKFILRIEDTDKERSKKEFEVNIIESLNWIGISHDEFYRQSERDDVYKKYLKKLVDDGFAYISKEEIKKEGDRAEVIRFKNPNKKIKFDDMIRGEIEFDTTDLGDFVIAKDLDNPLYHLAVVVDDYEMGVTHVIRGEDHISNTPRQILIQEAIGAERPAYAHIPLILASDRSKLSKRHGAVSMLEYKEQGYLPNAMVNFLALLGWSPQGKNNTEEKEILSLDELIERFEISKIGKSGSIFNIEKLDWINKQYMQLLPENEKNGKIVELLNSFLPVKLDTATAIKLVPMVSDRINKWSDIKGLIESGEFDFVLKEPEYDAKKLLWKDQVNENDTIAIIDTVVSLLQNIKLENFDMDSIREAIWGFAEEKGRGQVLWPMRYALSGKDRSPDPFMLANILGKEKTIERLHNALLKLKSLN